MNNICLLASRSMPVSDTEIYDALKKVISSQSIKKALIIPPDISRSNSYARPITQMLYSLLTGRGVCVDILPALGTHVAMSQEEIDEMYPGIPYERFLIHHWKTDTVRIGEIPKEYVSEVSEGYYAKAIPVDINSRLMDKSYDLIFSVGQVVPHEVVGMANYTKNLFVGCGGSEMINNSHYVGALYGMERMMGRDHSPVHKLFDYAQRHFLKDVPVIYILTVTTVDRQGCKPECVSIGSERDTFEKAIAVSQQKNITFLDRPVKKVVAYLDEKEFKRTWIGNKAIYRTRMCIEDGGELIIIAPGLCGCGEDSENDRLIRKYGYVGRDKICRLTNENKDLQDNLSVAAHIVHSSSDGRFQITYAPGRMSREEIKSVNYGYLSIDEAMERYEVNRLVPGFNTVNGEEIYYIPNPAVGLWAQRDRFFGGKE